MLQVWRSKGERGVWRRPSARIRGPDSPRVPRYAGGICRSVYFELDVLAMDDDRAYVLRRRNKDGVDEYLPVNTFTVQTYRCGLRAGDQLRLRHLLPHHDDSGPRGSARKPGEIWTVLTGSSDDPEALWLREPDGTLHSWSDDDSIFESFEKLPGV